MIFFFFQARAQALINLLQDTYDQIEQNNLSLSTFKFLAEQENHAIPRRLEVKYISIKKKTFKINFTKSFYS